MESRRRFLRWLIFSAIGSGMFLTIDGLTRAASHEYSLELLAKRSPTSNEGTGILKVKAKYFLMAEYVSVNAEYFLLQNPASLRNLLDAVVQRHPSFARMIPTMQIVLDGVPAQPGVALKDGDEVDFIPIFAGGSLKTE